MKKLLALLSVVCLLTGCGTGDGIPQTAEEVDNFSEALAFVSGSAANVTEVRLEVVSDAPKESLSVSEEDRAYLLGFLKDAAFAFEQYEPVRIYGGVSYAVVCTLADGEEVSLYPEEDGVEFVREEYGEDEKWHYVSYRLVPEESAVSERFYSAVKQIWNDAYTIPKGELRTVAQMLGDSVLSARQVILRCSLDGESGTEIRLYVDTADHPELFDALTGLTIEQTDPSKRAGDEEAYFYIAFHIGEEDYKFGDYVLTEWFAIRDDRIDIGVGTDISYRIAAQDGETESFAVWLEEWIYAHKDDDGVKVVRWDVD